MDGSTYANYGAGSGNVLYRNDGGAFVVVVAGIEDRGWGMGVAVGDYDGDGQRDLYVTNYGANALYRNRGDGTFTSVTAQAGVVGDDFSASAAFFDYDQDGDLDLYVANYVVFDIEPVLQDPDLGRSLRLSGRAAGFLRAAGHGRRARPALPQRRRGFYRCHGLIRCGHGQLLLWFGRNARRL